MTYKETLDYLFSRLPMFQRIGAAAYKADLSNTIALCNLTDNPQDKFRSIHIAGTNGKGSTSHMLAAILQSAGYKTGLYTSPHLKDFRERIRVNGKMIPKKFVTKFVEDHKEEFERIESSFFEWTVALAFDYFNKKKVDVAVIETGLGGRLDSTNVIIPLLSVITNISYDHAALLGDTLEKIAGEKAGIIKEGVPAVIGETQNTAEIFVKVAGEKNAPIFFADHLYRTIFKEKKGKKTVIISRDKKPLVKGIEPALLGDYQMKNISTVVQAIELLKSRGFKIKKKDIRNGIENTVTLTGLRGRWEILGKSPLIIADTGHNEAGIKEVLEQIERTTYKQLHFVLGMVNDKDISSILRLLPRGAEYYFCRASIPRALDENILAAEALKKGLKGRAYPTVREALLAAKRKAGKKDLIFIGGSTFTVADAL